MLLKACGMYFFPSSLKTIAFFTVLSQISARFTVRRGVFSFIFINLHIFSALFSSENAKPSISSCFSLLLSFFIAASLFIASDFSSNVSKYTSSAGRRERVYFAPFFSLCALVFFLGRLCIRSNMCRR